MSAKGGRRVGPRSGWLAVGGLATLAVGGLATLACAPAAPRGPALPPAGAERGEAVEPGAASRIARGEPVELRLSVVEPGDVPVAGGVLRTEALRGRLVLLVIAAADAPDVAELAHRACELGAVRPELAVVVVLLDDELDRWLGTSWTGCAVAWDPQGALAARIALSDLPAALLLDHDGRLVWQAAPVRPDELEPATRTDP